MGFTTQLTYVRFTYSILEQLDMELTQAIGVASSSHLCPTFYHSVCLSMEARHI